MKEKIYIDFTKFEKKLEELTIHGKLLWKFGIYAKTIQPEAKGFSYAKTTEEIREAYIRASDPIGAFIMDCVVQSPEDFVPKDELYNAYVSYCKSKKLIIVDKAVFSKNLRRYVVVEECRPKIKGERPRAWKGIKLVQVVQDVQVNSNFNIINNSNKLKIGNQLDKLDTLDTNWFFGF